VYIYSPVIALVVGWTHLRVDFLVKLSVMLLSVAIILVIFSQAPVIQLYYENPGAKWGILKTWIVHVINHSVSRKV